MSPKFYLIILLKVYLVVPASAQDTTRVSLLFLGDIMQHDSQIEAAYNPATGKYEYSKCFKLLKPYFQSVDLTVGNLELTLGGRPFKGYPQFSAPDELAVTLKEVGVDVLVTANNHSMDRRTKGLNRTISVLDSLGIQHTGTFRDSTERASKYPLILSKNGIRLALLNYTYGTNGIPVTKPSIVNLIDTALIRQDLIHANGLKPDAIAVFMHWGDEYQTQPNAFQKRLAEFCFKHGATLVIGAHPHVLQPMEWRREHNQLVAYSLGNFVSGQRPRNRDGGAMLQVELRKVISDSTSLTVIDTAHYKLQWVYKNPVKEFHILPVATVEKNPQEFIRDEASREAFKIFLDDSRKLLGRYNKNINEIAVAPGDSIIHYKIFLTRQLNVAGKQFQSPVEDDFIFGVERCTDESGNAVFFTGSFRKRESAEGYLQKIYPAWPESKVVMFINGNPVD